MLTHSAKCLGLLLGQPNTRTKQNPKCLLQQCFRGQQLRQASSKNNIFDMGSSMSSIASGWWWTFGSVPEVDAQALKRVSDSVMALSEQERASPTQPHIIDVRTDGEYRGGHIPGAVNASFLPPWNFEERIQPIISKLNNDTEIYVICLSAHRSIGAYKWLRRQGYTKVQQLKGGMQEYRKAQLPEVKAK